MAGPRVMANGAVSSWCLVNSGDTQGSELGPVLFNVFINHLKEEAECRRSHFAGGTKLGVGISVEGPGCMG